MLKSSKLMLNSKHLLLSNVSKSAYSGIINYSKPTNIIQSKYLLNAVNSIHTNTQLYFIKNNDPNAKNDPKIISTQAPKSVLGEDLKNILYSISVDENKLNLEDKKPNETPKKEGFFASLFSRENSWKVTLVFFTSMFGFGIVYVLTYWGN